MWLLVHTVLILNLLQIKLTCRWLYGKWSFLFDDFVSWSVLRLAVDYIYQEQDQMGEFIFMKDPNKAMMRLFKVTNEEIEEDEAEEELWGCWLISLFKS